MGGVCNLRKVGEGGGGKIGGWKGGGSFFLFV